MRGEAIPFTRDHGQSAAAASRGKRSSWCRKMNKSGTALSYPGLSQARAMRSAVPLLLLVSTLPFSAAYADIPGNHPAYLHALSDLREARADLAHKHDGGAVGKQEDTAIAEIGYAAEAIKRVAAADDKGLYNKPHEDAQLDHADRLHHAQALLKKAQADLAQHEDNPEAKTLQRHAAGQVQAALRAVETAIHDVEQGVH